MTSEPSIQWRGRGRPRVDTKFDDWHEVEDKKARKRIQDRLAQRARRNRPSRHTLQSGSHKQDSYNTPKSYIHDWTTYSSPSTQTTSSTDFECKSGPECYSKNFQLDGHLASTSGSDVNHTLHMKSCIGQSLVQHLSRDHSLLSWPAWPIFAALRQHGLMQGILAGNCHEEGKSILSNIALPEGLKPTPLQLVKPHRRVIDRFPFPRLRDNMILLENIIDLDEFVRDVFEMVGLTFRSESWRATWDPDAWALGPQFSQKWGYLFN